MSEIDAIRAHYDQRQKLRAREREIRALSPAEITPALDAEALDCWMEYDRKEWTDGAIGILLARIDALETVARAARELIAEASQEWDNENRVYEDWWEVHEDDYRALKDALAKVRND